MKGWEKDRSLASDSEFSDYKKEIEATDNVILCVAKAERMVREIGRSLLSQPDQADDDGDTLEEASDQGRSQHT
jgi:hypothetical protein